MTKSKQEFYNIFYRIRIKYTSQLFFIFQDISNYRLLSLTNSLKAA